MDHLGLVDGGTTDFLLHARPLAALERLYAAMGSPFSREARAAVERYLAQKPQHKFGAHRYEVDRDDRVRRLFARYQSYFAVPSEE